MRMLLLNKFSVYFKALFRLFACLILIIIFAVKMSLLPMYGSSLSVVRAFSSC